MASGGDDAREWERDWRSDVAHQMADSAQKHAQTAIILERLDARQAEHDRRIEALEGKPAETRAWFNTFTNGGGCLSAIVMAGIAIVGILISSGVSLAIALLIH